MVIIFLKGSSEEAVIMSQYTFSLRAACAVHRTGLLEIGESAAEGVAASGEGAVDILCHGGGADLFVGLGVEPVVVDGGVGFAVFGEQFFGLLGEENGFVAGGAVEAPAGGDHLGDESDFDEVGRTEVFMEIGAEGFELGGILTWEQDGIARFFRLERGGPAFDGNGDWDAVFWAFSGGHGGLLPARGE